MQAISQQSLQTHTLQDAFLLQDEVRELKTRIKVLERDIEDRETKISEIITSHQQTGQTVEGPFFIEEKPGRETVDVELLKRRFPWVAEKVIKLTERATKKDVAQHLPGADVDLVVKRSTPSYSVGYDIRSGVER